MSISLVFRLASTVTIAWMTIETTTTHIDWTQSVESTFSIGVVVLLEKILAFVEGSHHTCIFHCFRGLFESSRGIYRCSAKQSACIIFFRIVCRCRVADFPGKGLFNGFITAGTSGSDESTQ